MEGKFGTDGNYEANFYDRLEEDQHSNNPSEGYNYRLATMCKTSHPGFYLFSCDLGKEIDNTKSKIQQLEAGNIQESSSRRAQTLQKCCLKLRHLYQSKSIYCQTPDQKKKSYQTKKKSDQTKNLERLYNCLVSFLLATVKTVLILLWPLKMLTNN